MITPDGIEVLNAARRILERVEKDAMRAAWSEETNGQAANLGRTAEVARAGADAIFSFLNVASNYGNVEMTYAQLHGREETEAVEV